MAKTKSKKSQKPKKTKLTSKRKQRKQKRQQETAELTALPSSLKLARRTVAMLRQHYKLFGKMLLIYGVLYFILVRSVPEFGLGELVDAVREEPTLSNEFDRVTVVLDVLFTGDVSGISVVYGLILIAIANMAILWTIRSLGEGQQPLARDGYYKGMTGIVPYTIVVLVIALQMLPFALGGLIHTVALEDSIAVVGYAEQLFFVALWALLSVPTLYWLGSSMIALIVASIPGYYPGQALRTAKELVKYRRVEIIRRLIGGLLIFGVILMAVLVFTIVVLPDLGLFVRDLIIILAPFLYNIYTFNIYGILLSDD